jgi:hypothetical protein
MTVALPNALALGAIADGSLMIAADERNNFAAVQVGVNGLIAMFAVAPTKGDLIVSAGGGSFDHLPVGVNGQTIVADSTQPLGAKYAYPPGYEIGYTEFTAPVTITATVEATPTDVVSAGAITFDGTAVWVEFFAPFVQPAAAVGATVVVDLWQDATNLGRIAFVESPSVGSAVNDPVLVRRKITPAAGSKTLKFSAWQIGGNGSVGGGAGGVSATLPGFIRITKA